jgi:hypothetical protein
VHRGDGTTSATYATAYGEQPTSRWQAKPERRTRSVRAPGWCGSTLLLYLMLVRDAPGQEHDWRQVRLGTMSRGLLLVTGQGA